MATGFFMRLEERARQIDSLLCVGLDPRVPDGISSDELTSTIVDANKRIIEASSPYTLCYKPNIAFYEAWGEPGLLALRATLALIPHEIPVILDAKRGDIGATAEAYARMAWEELRVDGITVSPYMGWDSVEPFARDASKGVFVLCKTSNPGSNDLQLATLGAGVQTLYQRVADLAASWGPSFGLVVAANDRFALESIRSRHPGIWFLAPGIGTQGGSVAEAVQSGLSADGSGLLLVVARGVAEAPDPGAACKDLVAQYRQARNQVMAARSQAGEKNQVEDILTRSSLARKELKERVLRGLIRNGCFKTGEFKLKSGETSPFYVDLRRVMSDPELMKDVGLAYASLLGPAGTVSQVEFKRIAGIPLAAIALATVASLATGIPMIFPRMQQKEHGTGLKVEGEYQAGEEILLLDDLITTGKSKLEAAAVLRDAGLEVRHLAVLLERGAQGRKDMAQAGIELHSFAHISEFLPLCQDMGLIDAEERTRLEAYALKG